MNTRKIILLLLAVYLFACTAEQEVVNDKPPIAEPTLPRYISVSEDVQMGSFPEWIDSVLEQADTLPNYSLTEHLLVQNNPWLIDTLAHTDYYYQKSKGNFVYDPNKMVVLKAGQQLELPDEKRIEMLLEQQAHTYIDVNIPEFALRIYYKDSVLYQFPVRVGQDRRKYLAMAGGNVNLRTRTGEGQIVRINRDPAYINPANNHRYKQTRRDDGERTLLPRIPWLEPQINGQRYGQLIHPTTNIATLGRAYSNGCIGTSEAAAWRIYYHAPVGTRIRVRYELEPDYLPTEDLPLKSIYPGQPLVGKEDFKNIAAYITVRNECYCNPE